MGRGRPSKYDPAFCDRIIELAKDGASQAEMELELDIAHSTFHLWIEKHPDFSDAVKRANRLSQGWWERQGRIATFGGHEGFNATSFIFNMKNRFKEDWRDKVEQEHSGSLEVTSKEQRDAAVSAAARADG